MFLFFIIQLKKTFLIIIKRQFLINMKVNIQFNRIMHLKPFNFLIKYIAIILDWIFNNIKSSMNHYFRNLEN